MHHMIRVFEENFEINEAMVDALVLQIKIMRWIFKSFLFQLIIINIVQHHFHNKVYIYIQMHHKHHPCTISDDIQNNTVSIE